MVAKKPRKERSDESMKRQRSICIVCRHEKSGSAVKDDVLIRSIRSIKQALNIAANNRLVVCEECAPAHRQRREAFERKLLQYGAFGAILVIAFTLLSRTIQGFLMSLLLGAFVASLAIFQYTPASEAR